MKCPRCGLHELDENRVRNALSRKDNKTYVCRACGIDEAFLVDPWPGYPDLVDLDAKELDERWQNVQQEGLA